MCSNVITLQDGTEIACRKCNECIKLKKNDWVARALAEYNTTKNMMVIMLSYNSDNQTNDDGSKAFNYKHVNSFLKRLRRAIEYKTKQTGTVRFLCAGENGSKKGRVHWHIIIFTDEDLTDYGKWTAFNTKNGYKKGQKVKDREHKFDNNINWSLWPHGFVHMQQSNEGGVYYCLKYAFKDQFNIVKSKGTMRETKAENYASSYFRMSKQPPIGQKWLDKKLADLEAKRSVLTTLNLKIPNLHAYWYPRGLLRERLLKGLYNINQKVISETGRSAPQMQTLLNSVVDQEKERDILQHGKEIKEEDEELEDGTFERQLKIATTERAVRYYRKQVRKRCGSINICADCKDWLTETQKLEYKSFKRALKKDYNKDWTQGSVHPRTEFNQWYSDRYGDTINPFCRLEHTDQVRRSFSQYNARGHSFEQTYAQSMQKKAKKQQADG